MRISRLQSRWLVAAALFTAGLGACAGADRSLAPDAAPRPALSATSASGRTDVVISQVYGGGGNAGATLRNDFVELFNPGPQAVSLAGWSVQYASAAGTSWQVTPLSGTIQPGGYYLVQQAAGAGGTVSLPTPDATGTIPMSATAGKVWLVRATTALSGTCPTGASVVDQVSFGTGATDCTLGTTATLSSTTAAIRGDNGCRYTGSLSADFATGTPSPRNGGSPTVTCAATEQPVVASVVVTPPGATIAVGATQALTARALDAQGTELAGLTFTWASGDAAVATVSTDGVVTGVVAGSATITATAPNGVSGSATVTVGTATPPAAADVRVTELHYDNTGDDVGEKIEVEGDAGGSLAGWKLVLYSGSTGSATAGQSYGTITLSGTIPASCGTRGVLAFDAPGLQNGDKDGFALVNAAGQVVEFLSYEGSFTATNGPAAGMTSTDVGVDQDPAPAAGRSLQRAGNGTWFGPYANTFGACNPATPPAPQTGITFSGRLPSDPALPTGFQDQLFATLRDANTGASVPTTFAWSSETPAIAAVDQRGVVTALAEGTAVIRATAADGTTSTISLPTEHPVFGSAALYKNPLAFGTPADATPDDELRVSRSQYELSYNTARGTPNWVAYHLTKANRGDIPGYRCDCFTVDPKVTGPHDPGVSTADYTGSGFDRGHMVRSNDRELARGDQAVTYYMTNVVPQYAALNQGRWNDLEAYLQTVAEGHGLPEVYIVTGPRGAAGTIANGRVVVPTHTWKVAVVLPAGKTPASVTRVGDILDVIAVDMPNVPNLPRDRDWQAHRVTVDSVERATGYDLLSALPDGVEDAVEAGARAPTARITGDGVGGGAEGDALAFSATTSSDPDVGGPLDDVLSYLWTVGGEAAGIEPTLTRTFAASGSYAVRLIVSDRFGAADTATSVVTVTNVAPTVQPFAGASLLLGEPFETTGTFSDPGADAWSATVVYGDVSSASPLPLAGKRFDLSHLYTAAGSYTVLVVVRDEADAGTRTASVVVKAPAEAVADVGALVSALGGSNTVSASSPAGGSLTAGEVNSLRSKLDAAAQQLRSDRPAGVNVLRAFLSELEAFVSSGRLAARQVEPIVTLTNRVIRSASR